MRRVELVVLSIGLLAGAVGVQADDIGVVPTKLVVVDKLAAAGKAKAVFVAKDPAATKGAGLDVEQISVQLEVAYGNGNAVGAFVVPSGTASGWLVNKESVAKYVNKDAPAGPTETKVAVIKPGKLLKLVGKGLGDTDIDILGAGDPGGPVYTAYCVTNGSEENCHCSEFTGCAWKPIAGGTGAKLVCKTGARNASCGAPTSTSMTTTTTTATATTQPGGNSTTSTTDVDECATGTHNCDVNATCTNLPGSFSCLCNSGWQGDGFTCTDIDECALNADNCDDATATCVNLPGSFLCSCNAGLGDCDANPANGCESDLSDVPNCGACGNSCDDGDPCTFNACVANACAPPVNRRQCANVDGCAPNGCAACGFADSFPGCSNPDTDGDGLNDVWEDAQAIDLDCDGDYDANDVTLPNADKLVKDVYLKISWMAQSPFDYAFVDTDAPGPDACPARIGSEPATGHMPEVESVDAVVAAFSGAHLQHEFRRCTADLDCASLPNHSCVDFVCLPNCNVDSDCGAVGGSQCVWKDDLAGRVCRKWRLHAEVASAGTAHYDVLHFGPAGDSPLMGEYTDACTGVSADRHANFYDLKATEFSAKEALFKRWGIFAHKSTCSTTTGCALCPKDPMTGTWPVPNMTGLAEVQGNDFMVTLAAGNLIFLMSDEIARKIKVESGGLMHELGHTLGLRHGGPAPATDIDVKPNHLSVMNRLYQLTGIPYSDGISTDVPCPDCFRPDYSRAPLAPLNEASLMEMAGVGGEVLPPAHENDLVQYFTAVGCPTRCGTVPSTICPTTGPVVGPIDWNRNGTIDPTTISADLNGNGVATETFVSADDWNFLSFDFQCSPWFVD